MKKLLILDFGSQYTHLIKSILQKSGYYSEILAADVTIDVLEQTKYEGLILSGGASSVNNSEINFDYEFLNLGLPILGICYGHQLIASHFGAKVKGASHEYGETSITINNDTDILSGLNNTNVWMSHGDSVISLPIGAEVMAYTNKDPYTALLYRDKNIRTIQFHPEVTHTQNGESVLINFAKVICRMSPSSAWTPSAFIEEYKQIYRDSNLEGKKLVLGLSGGVDSMTLAAFMRTFVNRDNFLCIYVDSGLMQTETKQEVIEFCKQYDIALETVEAEERFFKILSGIDDPREKGKVIGHEFIRIFDEIAKDFGAEFLLQGTIWSDVVESGVTKFSSQIKPHHNVACIPVDKNVKIIEPFRDLFKNQVRDIAAYLDLPLNIVNKKVFPGPGFAIRVDGEVTKEKVSIVRKATEIVSEVVERSSVSNQIWMAFAILANARSLGVKGDNRVWNEFCVVVRIIESKNSMTANFSRLAMSLLPEISKRIISETTVGRVVYDITDKPPATIEWQ